MTPRIRAVVQYALLSAAMALPPPVSAAAQPACPFWSGELHLEGRVGNAAVRAYLYDGYPAAEPDALSGALLYPEWWLPNGEGLASTFSLDGRSASGCRLRLEESAESGRVTAEWIVELTSTTRLEGERRPTGSQASEPVALSRVNPTDCRGQGAWELFSSDRWPIRFEYPQGWRLAEAGRSLAVACPDPARVARGMSPIVLTRGAGAGQDVTLDNGRHAREIDDFRSFDGREWRYGASCDGDSDEQKIACARTRQSARLGMTVLQGAAGEHRLYRPGGGYIGQGPGMLNYLFLLPDAWVTIHGDDAPGAILDRLGTPGPVLFDGDAVIQRLVRSIRPVEAR